MRKINSFFSLRIFAFLALVLLSSCGRQNTPANKSTAAIPLPSPPCVVNCEPGAPGGRLVIATFGDPKTFNPITANESSSEQIYRLLFWKLINMDLPTSEPKPGLAESWSVAPDQRTWTFKLRQNLFWSDGQPLTADDVVFTFNRAIYDPAVPNSVADQCSIDKTNFTVSKIDALTVQIVTPAIYAPLLESLDGVYIIPQHVLQKAVDQKRFASAFGVDSQPADVVGSGPFRLKAFKQGEYTLLERNPYFLESDKAGQRLPYLDTVIFPVVPNQHAVSLQFLAGKSDINEHVMPDEFLHYQEDAKKGKFQLLDLGIGPEKLFFWPNQNPNTNPKTGKPYVDPKKLKLFRDVKFRQALAYSVDRASIVKAVYDGRAEPNYGYITSANPKWRNPNVKTYPYDLDKARALLAEIGIKDRDAEGHLKDADWQHH